MGFTDLFEPSRLLTYFLIIMRMGGLFFTAPVFSSSSLLNPVRMILVLIISLLLLPVVTPVTITDPNILWLVVSVAKEILIGICIGGMTSLLFSGLQLGGYLVDYQIGFSMVSVIDPSTNSNVSFTGQIYNILGTLIYLGIYGHHIFLRAGFLSCTQVRHRAGLLTGPAGNQDTVSASPRTPAAHASRSPTHQSESQTSSLSLHKFFPAPPPVP